MSPWGSRLLIGQYIYEWTAGALQSGLAPAPSLSTIKEDISAFSNLENNPFSRIFGPKKTPFSVKMQSFEAKNLPLFWGEKRWLWPLMSICVIYQIPYIYGSTSVVCV